MSGNSCITELIYSAIDHLNQFLPTERRLKKNPEELLWDEESGGNLDSLGMVTFIVALEQEIEKELGVSVMLVDDLLISEENNPFESVDVLSHNISRLLELSSNYVSHERDNL